MVTLAFSDKVASVTARVGFSPMQVSKFIKQEADALRATAVPAPTSSAMAIAVGRPTSSRPRLSRVRSTLTLLAGSMVGCGGGAMPRSSAPAGFFDVAPVHRTWVYSRLINLVRLLQGAPLLDQGCRDVRPRVMGLARGLAGQPLRTSAISPLADAERKSGRLRALKLLTPRRRDFSDQGR